MKENLKPCVYKLWNTDMVDRVLFVERSGELRVVARLSASGTEPEGNRVLTGRDVILRMTVSTCRPETG